MVYMDLKEHFEFFMQKRGRKVVPSQTMDVLRILEKKSIAYLDRWYLDKRKILHQYAIKDEIKDFVTRIAEEAINYNDDNYFCSVSDIPDNYDQSMRAKYQENFRRIYK